MEKKAENQDDGTALRNLVADAKKLYTRQSALGKEELHLSHLSEILRWQVMPVIETSKKIDLGKIDDEEDNRLLYRFFYFVIGLCYQVFNDSYKEINEHWDNVIEYCFESMKKTYLKCHNVSENGLCFEWYLLYGQFSQLRGPGYLGIAIENYQIFIEKYDRLKEMSNKSQRDENRLKTISRQRQSAQSELDQISIYWDKYSKYEKTWKMHQGFCTFEDARWTQTQEIEDQLKRRFEAHWPDRKADDCIIL